MPKLSLQSIDGLFDDASSTRPVPGGGAITALTGALGVSLILKALRISVMKRPDIDAFSEIDAQLVALSSLLRSDADTDSESFEAYICAAKMPRGTEAEKSRRKASLTRAAVSAADAAWQTYEHADQIIILALDIKDTISPNIKADLVAGIELLQVSKLVAVENIQANLPSMPDNLAGEMRKKLPATLRSN